MDETRYGATGQLPVAAAMIKYANGELRKFRSEKISLNPPPPDFVLKLEMRCAFLLDAQSSYADAIRSVDLQWAAMSGYRVGEMYRTLHHAPHDDPADRQGEDGARQAALLRHHARALPRAPREGPRDDEAHARARRADRGGAAWMKRAEAREGGDGHALEEEKAMIKKFPFTEETLEKTLEIMKKKAADDARRRRHGPGDHARRGSRGRATRNGGSPSASARSSPRRGSDPARA